MYCTLRQVWPYLLGHYRWRWPPARRAAAAAKCRAQYEDKLSEWLAAEAIVRQRDKEVAAASVARISGMNSNNNNKGSTASTNNVSLDNVLHLSNEVFESVDDQDDNDDEDDISSRTVSADKISTITEVRDNGHYKYGILLHLQNFIR